jgi:hypothetical protein
MKYTRHARYLLRTAMLLTVLMVVGHIHGHLCLDGQEPALSVHFETFNGHPDHEDDGSHDDVENELVPQGLLASKAPHHDAPALLLAFSLLFVFQPSSRQLNYQRRDEIDHPSPPPLFPPSRGPPSHSS